jgi:putative peptide zinc metalloprotease protein
VLKLARLQKDRAQAEQLARAHRSRGDAAQNKLVESEIAGLDQQLAELEQQVAQLEVRAPVAGRVICRQIAQLPGQYLRRGDEIARLGMESSKQLRVSLAQADVEDSQILLKDDVTIMVPGHSVWSQQFARIEPRASREPPDQSMLATAGGPLTVEQDDDGNWILTEPRLLGHIELNARQSSVLRAGQRATVVLGSGSRSLGSRLLDRAWQSLEVVFSNRPHAS